MNRVLFQTLFALLLCIPVLSIASSAHAQLQQLPGKAYLELYPQYPKPGEEVTATFKTTSLDVGASLIEWRVNGEVVLQGYGEDKYSFFAGPVGSQVGFDVYATSYQGNSIHVQRTLGINDVSFVWEARSYVPPFFSGRALVAPGARAVVVAFPVVFNGAGVQYSPDNLIYEWSVNGDQSSLTAGKGKSSVVLQTKYPFEDFGVTLLIKNLSGETLLARWIQLPISNPRIIFYRDSSLLGIEYAHAFTDSYSLSDEELTLVAEPYNASALTRTDPALEYSWDVAGQKINSPGSLVLRPDGAGNGSAQISLTVVNLDYMLQRFQGRTLIDFTAGAQSSGGSIQTTTPL